MVKRHVSDPRSEAPGHLVIDHVDALYEGVADSAAGEGEAAAAGGFGR